MKKAIHFVDDEGVISPYVIDARLSKRFGDCELVVSDTINRAIRWAYESTTTATVFVLDSRMRLDTEAEEMIASELVKHGVDYNELRETAERVSCHVDTMTGTLGAVVLKALLPNCRIILLSAYAELIDGVRKMNPRLDGLLDTCIARILGKPQSDARLLDETLIAELGMLPLTCVGTGRN